MDEKKLQAKIAELEQAIELQYKKAQKASVRNTLIYALLALFVLLYTSALYSQIRENMTPENIAALLSVSAREKMPAMRQAIREQMQPMAATVVARSFTVAKTMLPGANQYFQNQIDIQVQKALDQFEKKNMPVIETAISDTITTVLDNQDTKDGEALGKAIATRTAAKAKEEMDKMLNAEFYSGVADLQKNLNDLRTKNIKDLTKQDAAERKFIVSWLKLTELSAVNGAETGITSSFSQVFKEFTEQLKSANEILKEPADNAADEDIVVD
ncbi:MAG: hypothetical protein IKB22_06500 [Lentisphaeria bacterium]|nr:hypothetical protein [Lentisphaeria bacterium]